MTLARELGYTLSEITAKMSYEELLLWNAYFEVEAEKAEKKQGKRR
jgi:hypothetical protein